MSNVRYETFDNVALVTIDRPEALNALNSDMLNELKETFEAIDLEVIRAVVITGAGSKSFVAGADIGEMQPMGMMQGIQYGTLGNKIFRMIETFPVPVIAAVNGYALGGGNELCMACDIRICSDNAIFGQPEVGLGITPGFGGTQRLARLVPVGKAKEMLYTGKNVKADEAYRIGLVNAIYSKDALLPAALKMAKTIAANAPIAVRNCKTAVNNGLQKEIEDALEYEFYMFGACFDSEDQKEGMTAFLEKRKEKNFKNR